MTNDNPKTTVIPKADWILYRQETIKTSSGIVFSDGKNADSGVCKNIVISAGEKVTRVVPGDEIVVLPKTAIGLEFPGRDLEKDLRLVKEEFVIATLKDQYSSSL